VTSELVRDLLAFITDASASEERFNALALRLFAHQFQHNVPFQRYCQQRGKTLRSVRHWHDIPAVPINAFKDLTLSCVPPESCQRVFMTSGTTRGDVKGRHYHPSMVLYDPSMQGHFQASFMQGRERMRMGILFPTEQAMPNSSLAHYLALALKHFGTPDSGYFLDSEGLRFEALCEVLTQAQHSGEPLALLGASYSFVHVMDRLQATGTKFQLPAGSRLLDTGGFKGQSRDIPMREFYDLLSTTFGVPAQACINMYGMTELSTQWYDAGNAELPSIKRGPHWIRWRLIDPITGRDVPPGQEGIVVHCDLANYNAVTTLLTEDVGVAAGEGFKLLGRAQGSQAKGCSIAIDQFLKATQP